jgi:hypothetical protein
MAEFQLNGETVELPDNWSQITFDRFLGFAQICKQFKEREEVKNESDDVQLENALQDLEDNTKILAYWCNMSNEEISMIDLEDANNIMKHLSYLNEEYNPINIGSFTIEDQKFFLPEDLMAKSSFGRYVEAEQLELQTKLLKNGRLEIMPRQVAILCKKEGETEKLNDTVIDQRAILFRKLDMATIWDIGFFLTKLEQKLTLTFLISQADQMKAQQKQELQLKAQ